MMGRDLESRVADLERDNTLLKAGGIVAAFLLTLAVLFAWSAADKVRRKLAATDFAVDILADALGKVSARSTPTPGTQARP